MRDRAIELGYIENGTGQHQSNTVYSPDGLSPSITTFGGGGTQQIKIIQPISTNARYIEVASTILSGYHRSNMTGFNADNAVLEIYKTERNDANGTT